MATRESEEPSSAPRPPKKRFIASSSSSSPARSIDEDLASSEEDAADPLMEPFEEFRRDAIFRQWKEYMRFGKRYKKRKISAEKRQQADEASLSVWDSHFQQLRKALSDLVSEEHAESLKAAMHQRDENSRYQSILDSIADDAPAMATAMKAASKVTACEVTRSAQSFKYKRERLAEKIKPLLDSSLQDEYQDALSRWQSGEKSINKAKDNLELHTMKYLVLTEELQLLTRKLEVVDAIVRDTRLELVNAENRLAPKNAESGGNWQEQCLDIGGSSNQQQQSSSGSSGRATTDENFAAEQQQENSLTQIQRMLDRQLQEIEAIKEERITLKQRIAQAEIDLIILPEARIGKLPHIYQSQESVAYFRQKSDRLLKICRELRQERDRLQIERRPFIQEHDADQLHHIKKLQKQLRELDRELNDVRGQRDALQVVVDEYKSTRESGGRASLPELQLIADTRRERGSIMENQLLQLRKKCAALTGNRAFYEMAMSINEGDITIEPAQRELSSLESTIDELRAQLAGQDDAADQQQNLDKEIEKMLEIQNVENKVQEFQKKYGFDVMNSDENAVLKILESTLESTEAKISETQKTLKSLELGESESASVVADAFKGSTMFDEQNMAKIKDLVDVEEEIIRLRSERSRYNQAFTNLNKAKDSNGMVAVALKKQIDKELAYIKELNEREKNMNSQLTTLERELTASNAALETYQSKGDELDETLKDLKEKTNLAKEKAVEFEKSIKEKIRLIEQGAHERLRLEENSELLRRKLEAATRVERPAEIQLREQQEEYRQLLYCGSCGQTLKSHVIMRCMHTFCKNCLDARIETRQRRCPSCGESFGVNDVKQFYF
ncbi:hypothetical protein BDB00DRAFT_292994 [Zychaea mexicana]|uniref:uncharacterized protein n=1 Tax=Zychaea mexicana TaxID=64656 RepID=UPI0022FF31B0|nr:uncharacterized protein BDB00DRAFT_292994 [Zychaea mexicana]KAI9494843.1 hypothetical protein BDB00DRAFT_292994 [Zychaea mexicana]